MKMQKHLFSLSAAFCIFFVNAASAASFYYEKGVPKAERRLIEKDIDFLERLDFPHEENLNAKDFFDLGNGRLTGSLLRAWIEERVKIILSESAKVSVRYIKDPNVLYPNPNVLPDVEMIPSYLLAKSREASSEEMKPTPMMQNEGGPYYRTGKLMKVALSVTIDDQVLPVLSPRIGIVRIGKDHFDSLHSTDKDIRKFAAAPISRANRLIILIHEARHSDGNGKSIGFPHTICPKTMPGFAGLPACDRTLNGSYTAGVLAAKALRSAWDKDSEIDKDLLFVIAADYASRVLETTYELEDPLAMELAQRDLHDCILLKNLPAAAKEKGCDQIQARIKAASKTKAVKSEMWDPAPESRIR